MGKGSFSLLRQRRRFMQRTEDWFSINRFKSQHEELLTSPTYKYLEKQELFRGQEQAEDKAAD